MHADSKGDRKASRKHSKGRLTVTEAELSSLTKILSNFGAPVLRKTGMDSHKKSQQCAVKAVVERMRKAPKVQTAQLSKRQLRCWLDLVLFLNHDAADDLDKYS